MSTLKTRKCLHEGTKEDAGERRKDRCVRLQAGSFCAAVSAWRHEEPNKAHDWRRREVVW
jgi:hypothetical protein